ncbi:unnamed protein product [Orchesella dallaii]|uniref:Uncharacterized protein n=1 Tax=Orchesella dallaii TaxID=48710 RepID=A0ABP1RUS0_9HEXA
MTEVEVVPVGKRHKRSGVVPVFHNAQLALKETFESVTNKEYALSPGPKQKPCSFSNTLLVELTNPFPTLQSKVDKYRLQKSIHKRFSINDIEDKISKSHYMIRNASHLRNEEGAFSTPKFIYGHPLSQETLDLVKQFYLSSDNSRPLPRSDDVVYVKTDNGQK